MLRTSLNRLVASLIVTPVVASLFSTLGHAQPFSRQEMLALRQKLDESLRQELTQDWYPRAVDRQRGGFHQTFARDWSPLPDADTFLVYQARLTWTAAAFARYSRAHRERYAGYARHAIALLARAMGDGEFGGFHLILD